MHKRLIILPLLLILPARAAEPPSDTRVTVEGAAVYSDTIHESLDFGSKISRVVVNIFNLDLKFQNPAFKSAIAVKLEKISAKFDDAVVPIPDLVHPGTPKGTTIAASLIARIPGKLPTRLTSLSATATIILADKTETLTLEKIATLESKQLDDKKLAAAGVTITVNKANTEGLALLVEGNTYALTAVRIKSGKTLLETQILKTATGTPNKTFVAVMTEMPDNPIVELDLATAVREIQVPVALKDITLKTPATRPATLPAK